MSNDRPAERGQTVPTAWTGRLRAEVLRVGTPELARVAQVGIWLATYADPDGSNCFPGQKTLATLAGGTDETVSRAVRVLEAVGMLSKKRGPNATYRYQLLIPSARPDWALHMHLFTETRQKLAHAKKKAREAEARAHRVSDTVRGRVPDTVHGGTPDTVRGRVPDTVHGGGYQYTYLR